MSSVYRYFSLLLGLATAASALNLTDFRICVSPSGYQSTCYLDPLPWDVYSTITIGRSNITIAGAGTGVGGPSTLVRAFPANGPILEIQSGLQNVTIRNLTIDGRRGTYPSIWGNIADLELSGSPQYTTVSYVRIFDSVDYGLRIAGTGMTIQYSQFETARYSLLRDSSATNYYIANCTFSRSGGSAISTYSGNGTIQWSYFYGNHAEFPHNSPGGQIHLEAVGINVYDNYFDGQYNPYQPPPMEVPAMEVYGSNHNIRRNYVLNHSGPGISLVGVSSTVVSDAYSNAVIYNNNRLPGGWLFPGIEVKTVAYPYNTSTGITIDDVSIRWGHGFPIDIRQETGGSPISISVINSCWSDNINNYIRTVGSVALSASNNRTSGCR